MNEPRTYSALFRRTLFPLLISGILILATILISTSALIRIEDVYINRIIAGTYGSPDWRVQEMNPILAQILSLFYRIVPSLNWYGLILLALLWISSATWLSFAGRTSGGIIPAALILSPIILLSTNAMISTVVCALCASAGAFALMDGLQRQKSGLHGAVLGAVLSAFALSLSMKWGLILSVGAMLCWLPGFIRENRMRGLLTGLPVLAIIAAALFGYNALMYSAPDLASYRENYALYERVQHSHLKEESQTLVQTYGISVYSEGQTGHDHDGDGLPDAEDTAHEEHGEVDIPATVFDTVGWSINDSSLFFIRYSADTSLVNPDTLRTLANEAKTTSFSVSFLARELFNTIKKPQFLLLIGLFIITALGLLLTRRRKGLVVLLAALITFGGHIYALATYYNAYADIAPFYLLAITALLYHFNGEEAKNWLRDKIQSPSLRILCSGGALLVFAAILAGLFYYTKEHPANDNPYTLQAYEFIAPYVSDNPDMLFIGDNPHDRFKPSTLAAPVRGADQNLLAGSYDLYSPRATELMNRYGLTNPMTDGVNRDDIGYISMSYPESMVMRYAEHYQVYLKPSVDLVSQPEISERIFALSAYTDDEITGIVDQLKQEEQEQKELAELWTEALTELETQTEGVETDDTLLDAQEQSTSAPVATVSPSPAPTIDESPAPTATPAGNG